MRARGNGLAVAITLCLPLFYCGCGSDDANAPGHNEPSPLPWQLTNLSDGKILAVAVNNVGTVFASVDGDGVYCSADNGAVWTKLVNGPFLGNAVAAYAQCFLIDGGTVWAGTDGAGIHRSTDEGVTWTEVPADPTMGRIYALCAARGTVYCASDYGIFKLDGGDHWIQLDSRKAVAMCGQYEIFAGSQYQIGGTAAILYNPGPASDDWFMTAVDGNQILAMATAADGTPLAGTLMAGVLRCREWWRWEPSNDGLDPFYTIWAIAAAPPNHVFISVWASVFRSTDNGNSWRWCSDTLARQYIYCLAVNPTGYVFAGTEAGVWRARF